MAEYTKNYNLEKQQESDYVNVKGINDNFDVIDEELKSTAEKAEQAFLSASNGKQVIKTAIAGKDPSVTIPTEATFAQLAEAIGQIETGVNTDDATAIAEYLLTGLTAYVKGMKVTGTMPVKTGAENVATYRKSGVAGKFYLKPPKGYYDGVAEVNHTDNNLISDNIKAGVNVLGVSGKSTVVDTQDAVLDPEYLVQGYSGYDDGVKKAGTMPITYADLGDSIPSNGQMVYSGWDGNLYALMQITPNAAIRNANWVRSYQPDLLSANILQGKNIFGVAGSAVHGKRWASGTKPPDGTTHVYLGRYYSDGYSAGTAIEPYIQVDGLDFMPSCIILVDARGVNSRAYIWPLANGDAEYFGNAFVRVTNSSAGLRLYLSSGSFRVPAPLSNGTSAINWIAYE